MINIIDCVSLANRIKKEIKEDVLSLETKPCLAIVLVGNNDVSLVYSKAKEKALSSAGMMSKIYTLPKNTKEEKLVNVIKDINNDKAVHAVLIEMPLPEHIDIQNIYNSVDRFKDVDCANTDNKGLLFSGRPFILPATPYAALHVIKSVCPDMEGLDAVVVGRSNIVGKPLEQLLMNENATTTIAHSNTRNLKDICKRADILCIAIGKPKFIDNDYIKKGAIVIDIGINVLDDNSIVGDVEFESITDASYISPVPRGIGVVTTAMILKNTLKLYKYACERRENEY